MFLHLLTSGEEGNKALISFLNAFLIIKPATFYRGSGVAGKGGKAVLKITGIPERKPARRPLQPGEPGCLKSRLLFRQPDEFKIKSLYCNDLILNIALNIKKLSENFCFRTVPTPFRNLSLPLWRLRGILFRPCAGC